MYICTMYVLPDDLHIIFNLTVVKVHTYNRNNKVDRVIILDAYD